MTTQSAYTERPAVDDLAGLRDLYELHLGASRAPKTTRIYLAAFDGLYGHLRDHGMPTTARGIRREHVESWFAVRRAKVAPATLSVEFRALAVFWKWALEEDEIERSPMERMKAPRVPDKPVPIVSDSQIRKLLKTADASDFVSRRDRAIMLLFYDTGMRLGELVGLRVGDVDYKAAACTAYVTGKAGHQRVVRFGRDTAMALARYVKMRNGHRYADMDALWLGQDGPIGPSAVENMIAKRCVRAGLPRLHPHQWRHSFAHESLANGMAEGDLQRLAGWRSPQMLRRYGASLADARAQAAYTSPVDRMRGR